MREMYRMVFGEGIGELDAATRRICGFGEDPPVGELCKNSGAGGRAKLGIRKAFIGLDLGDCLVSEPSEEAALLTSRPDMFEELTSLELITWCILDGPFPGLLLPELQRPQMGLSGLP
jgi:hypothetical protein